jgi:hypothetical protein
MSQMDLKLHQKLHRPHTYTEHKRANIRKKAFDICVELRRPIPSVLRS